MLRQMYMFRSSVPKFIFTVTSSPGAIFSFVTSTVTEPNGIEAANVFICNKKNINNNINIKHNNFFFINSPFSINIKFEKIGLMAPLFFSIILCDFF